MRNSKNIRRKGFTLVELLIVIVVIGILSAMMMLSSTEATTSAKATAIISNLRNIKTAALAYYADNPTATVIPGIASIDKYLKDGSSASISADHYYVVDGNDNRVTGNPKQNDSWYVLHEIQGTTNEKSKIAEKLNNRKDQVGIAVDTSNYYVDMFIR